MKLEGQRRLASRILDVGKNKVWFDKNRLDEIKKAITSLDIKELVKDGAIKIRMKKKIEIKKEKRLRRRGAGSIKMKVSKGKERYIKKIRKLRKYIHEIYDKKILTNDEKKKLRKMAKAGEFKGLRHMKEYISGIMNKKIEGKK